MHGCTLVLLAYDLEDVKRGGEMFDMTYVCVIRCLHEEGFSICLKMKSFMSSAHGELVLAFFCCDADQSLNTFGGLLGFSSSVRLRHLTHH